MSKSADYLSWLQNLIEEIQKVRQVHQYSHLTEHEERLTRSLFEMACWNTFENELMAHVDGVRSQFSYS